MDCKVTETRQVKVVISKGEILELVAKKTGKLPPDTAYISLDDACGYGSLSSYGAREPTFDLTISWNEEIKNGNN